MQDRFYLRYVYNNKIYDVFAVDFFNKTAQLVSLDRAETLFTKIDTDKLFQCTGLRDKNGNLIFEGDIVEFRNPLGIKKGVIVYDIAATLFEIKYMDNLDDWELLDTYPLKVVGNILQRNVKDSKDITDLL